MTRRLLPTAPASALYPADGAWMARTDLHTTRLLGYTPLNLDAVTGLLIGVFGCQPSLRHVSTVTPEILDFMSTAGLVIEEDVRVYRTQDEAFAAARGILDDGFRFIAPYPVPSGLYPEGSEVVPAPLYYRLNAKVNMPDLVDAAYLAPRQAVADAANLLAPVYLKAGGGIATGWGYAVRYCETPGEIEDAVAWFDAQGAGKDLIAEDAMDVSTCWCAHIGCSDDETRYLGAAEQTFSAPAQQLGSVIDPDRALPEVGQKVAVAAGERARRMGYRGIAALDIGLTRDGRCIAFDPNFRINASTTQILLHGAAVNNGPLRVSQSIAGASALPISEIIARLDQSKSEGWFVPTRLLDASLLPAAEGKSLWTGFVLGVDRHDAAARASALTKTMNAVG